VCPLIAHPPCPQFLKAATSNGGGLFFVRTVIMAFTIRDLSVLAYANGFTLWHYKTGMDSLADVACDEYFADASDMMAVGDMILISGAKACRILCIAFADAGNVRSVPVS
jgi:hypothetical protein